MPAKFLPPDDELQLLERQVTARLCGAGQVNFYSEVAADKPDAVPDYSIIFQTGSKRRVVKLNGKPTAADIPELVSAHQQWEGPKRVADLYSHEPPENHYIDFV